MSKRSERARKKVAKNSAKIQARGPKMVTKATAQRAVKANKGLQLWQVAEKLGVSYNELLTALR